MLTIKSGINVLMELAKNLVKKGGKLVLFTLKCGVVLPFR